MFNITLKLIFHFITFLVISFLYDSDDNLSERMEGSNYGTVMSFHHRVTQSFTEFYSFDFKLIKLCETLCYSVVN